MFVSGHGPGPGVNRDEGEQTGGPPGFAPNFPPPAGGKSPLITATFIEGASLK